MTPAQEAKEFAANGFVIQPNGRRYRVSHNVDGFIAEVGGYPAALNVMRKDLEASAHADVVSDNGTLGVFADTIVGQKVTTGYTPLSDAQVAEMVAPAIVASLKYVIDPPFDGFNDESKKRIRAAARTLKMASEHRTERAKWILYVNDREVTRERTHAEIVKESRRNYNAWVRHGRPGTRVALIQYQG